MTLDDLKEWEARQGYPALTHKRVHDLDDGKRLWIVENSLQESPTVTETPGNVVVARRDTWEALPGMIRALVVAGVRFEWRYRKGVKVMAFTLIGKIWTVPEFERRAARLLRKQYITLLSPEDWAEAVRRTLNGEEPRRGAQPGDRRRAGIGKVAGEVRSEKRWLAMPPERWANLQRLLEPGETANDLLNRLVEEEIKRRRSDPR